MDRTAIGTRLGGRMEADDMMAGRHDRRMTFSHVGLASGLAVLLLSGAAGLSALVRGLDYRLAVEFGVLGLGMGWLAVVLRLRRGGAAAGLLAGGVAASSLRVGQLAGPTSKVLASLVEGGVRQAVAPTVISDPTSTLAAWAAWAVRAGVLADRLAAWTGGQLSHQPAFDPVAAAWVWSLALSLAGAWAAWWAWGEFRPILAGVPVVALLASSSSYASGSTTALGGALLGWLMVLAFTRQIEVEARAWAVRSEVQTGLAQGMARLVLPLSLVMAFSSVAVSNVSLQQILETWRTRQDFSSGSQGDLARSLGVESVGRAPARPPAPQGGLPNRRLIGSGPELSHQIVMEVTLSSTPAMGGLQRLYWEGQTYDQYNGHGWQSSPTEALSYPADAPLFSGPSTQQIETVETFHRIGGDQATLYVGGLPLSVNQPVTAAWRLPGTDLLGLTPNGSGDYSVRAAVPAATEAALRKSGTDYPAWVTDRYLALPSSVPDRVLSLARDLTAAEPTPFDRAQAIQTYLRKIPYSLDLPQPPGNRDIVDYFLFDLRRGYCDYYASAMVVMARAAGIPARLAVGFDQGTQSGDGPQPSFVVTEADSHSWPELYFPGYGWIPFEPTAARAPLFGSGSSLEARLMRQLNRRDSAGFQGQPLSIAASRRSPNPWATWGLMLAGSLGLLLVVLWFGDAWRLRRLSEEAALEGVYRRCRRSWAGLTGGDPASETPFGLLGRVSDWAAGKDLDRLGRGVIASMSASTEMVVVCYVARLYAEAPVGRAELEACRRRTWTLRAQAIWMRLRLGTGEWLRRGRDRPGREASPAH